MLKVLRAEHRFIFADKTTAIVSADELKGRVRPNDEDNGDDDDTSSVCYICRHSDAED